MSTTLTQKIPRVLSVEAQEGYKLLIHFEDGVSGVISLEDRLFGPMFEPLHDVDFFNSVTVDDFGAPCWPNGADLAPDALYEMLKEK